MPSPTRQPDTLREWHKKPTQAKGPACSTISSPHRGIDLASGMSKYIPTGLARISYQPESKAMRAAQRLGPTRRQLFPHRQRPIAVRRPASGAFLGQSRCTTRTTRPALVPSMILGLPAPADLGGQPMAPCPNMRINTRRDPSRALRSRCSRTKSPFELFFFTVRRVRFPAWS